MQYRRWQKLEANKQTNKQVNNVKEKMLKNSVLSGSRTGQWPSQAFYLGFNWSLVPITDFFLVEREKVKIGNNTDKKIV